MILFSWVKASLLLRDLFTSTGGFIRLFLFFVGVGIRMADSPHTLYFYKASSPSFILDYAPDLNYLINHDRFLSSCLERIFLSPTCVTLKSSHGKEQPKTCHCWPVFDKFSLEVSVFLASLRVSDKSNRTDLLTDDVQFF